MPEHSTDQTIRRALRELEAGQYVAEDSRKKPLRVCEQQPQQDGLVHAVSSRGTVYALEDSPSGVRIHRGSSIEESVSDMDSDGFIDSLRVEEESEQLMTPLPDEIPAVQHLSGYKQTALVEGWAVGRLWVGYRDGLVKFNPLPMEQGAFEVAVEQGDLHLGDRPLDTRGNRLALVVNRF